MIFFSFSEITLPRRAGPPTTRSTDSSSADVGDHGAVLAGGQQRRLVDHVGQVGAGHPDGALGQRQEVDVRGERLALGVHGQDRLPALEVGLPDRDLPVEPAGPQQRRVQDVGPVGGGDQDDAALGLEAVHLDQQLVQGLLALVVAAAHAGAAVPADGVDLVDEDDGRRVRLGLFEQVADPGGADADEHLDEVRAGDRVERHAGLAGDGAGEQRLAGAGRAVEQDALGDLRAERLVAGRDSARKSRISSSSWTASSAPATSVNLVTGMSLVSSLALDLPNERTLLPPPWALFIIHSRNRMIRPTGIR